MKTLLRRLRGFLGNALLWGSIWFVIGFVATGAERFLGSRAIYLSNLIAIGVFAGLIGAITGGVFSAYIAARFRHMRVEELGVGQFALGGALVGVLSALLLNITGFIGPSILIRSDLLPLLLATVTFGTIGGVTALGSIKIAQRSLPDSTKVRQNLIRGP